MTPKELPSADVDRNRPPMRTLSALLIAGALAGCASTKPQALPDGSYRLLCSSTMTQCMRRSQQFCGDDDFEVIKKSDDVVYGVEGHSTGAEGAEVHFRCGQPREAVQWKLPKRKRAAKPPAPPAAKQASEPARQTCVPGVTQRCFGPGACRGAQACLPDGSGWGPCDCGSAADAGAAGAGGAGAAAAGLTKPGHDATGGSTATH
jgi:hypothetical protein